MGDAPGLATAVLGGVGVVLASWALVVKARREDSEPFHVLRRLWDWVEGKGLDGEVPRGIREDAIEVLYPDRVAAETEDVE